MPIILPLVEAAAHWPARGALIGLDLGTKTIGVAVSDPDRKLATGVETIARTAFTADAQRVLALAAERSVVGFVLGLPLNMDGSEGPRAQSTRALRAILRIAQLRITRRRGRPVPVVLAPVLRLPSRVSLGFGLFVGYPVGYPYYGQTATRIRIVTDTATHTPTTPILYAAYPNPYAYSGSAYPYPDYRPSANPSSAIRRFRRRGQLPRVRLAWRQGLHNSRGVHNGVQVESASTLRRITRRCSWRAMRPRERLLTDLTASDIGVGPSPRGDPARRISDDDVRH